MSLQIKGITYFTIAEMAADVGVSRQTLWRWRQRGLIPVGQRYRGRNVILSAEEWALVTAYAQRLEPVTSPGIRQVRSSDSDGEDREETPSD